MRKVGILMLLILLVSLISCSGGEAGFLIDPVPKDPGVAVDSSGITGEVLGSVTVLSEMIRVKLVGSNVENGFLYYFAVPALEKQVDGEWVRMPVTADYSEHLRGDPDYFWNFSNREDSEIMWATLELSTDSLCEKISAGQYRVCVFLYDKTLTIPFSVTE